MCGITGVYHFDLSQIIDLPGLKSMTNQLQYRGPDNDGYFIGENVGLGHRRLSIMDVDNGSQPMYSDDESIVLVLNGEIYNYIELREELISHGFIFKTNSDTEVVIKAYQKWGVQFQKKLNGMWAFALWDSKQKMLLISRDRIGEKPLFYSQYQNSLVFASEMKSLFEYGIKKEIREELIEIYLGLTYIPEPNTFFKDIFKLEPGNFILIKNNHLTINKYWDLPEIDEGNLEKRNNYVYERFHELFEDSIKIRMRCDVPFGAFLSGGLDSSSIVSLMAKNSKFPIQTFTMGFPEKEFDESYLAELVAKKFNTVHNRFSVTPDSLEEVIKICAFHFDEPFGDSSAIPTYYISKLASQKVKMVLTGDGGDEVLSGYRSFSGLKFSELYSKLPNLFQKHFPSLIQLASKNTRGSVRYKLNKIDHIIKSAALPFNKRVANKKPYTELNNILELTKGIKNKMSFEDYIDDLVKKIPYKNDFYKMMYLNIKHDLPNDYLVKVDRMSMANSIETRAPFLDYRLIEFMIQVDKSVKMQGWERKSVLRNTIAKSLPNQLLNAPKKGFGVPLREWFKERETFENLNFTKSKQLLNPTIIEKIVTKNREAEANYGNFIWTLIMLEKHL